MADQDLPLLDDSIVQLPQDMRDDLAEMGKSSLFFFCVGVLKMHDLTHSCHAPLCHYHDHNKKRFKMILYPRDHFKSSIITIGGAMQRVVRDRDSRQLIGNESSTNAQRFLRSIRQHAEGNRIFRALYSDIIPKDVRKVRWNDSELDFVRSVMVPEPSIDTVGMTGAFTSRHYTHITWDDPISEEAASSELVLQDVIVRLSATESLLVNPEVDTVTLVGTRWLLKDVYSWFEEKFGPWMSKFVRAAIENGEPIFPERFSLETLSRKRNTMGEYKFSCLYMNSPRNSEVQDFNVEDLRSWHWSTDESAVILFGRNGEEIDRWPLEKLDITTTVDLASAETGKSDRNAIVTCGVTPKSQVIVLDVFAKRCNPLETLEYIFAVVKRFQPRLVGIEDIAYQKAFKYFVYQAQLDRDMWFRIEPLKLGDANPRNKLRRIRGLQPVAATGRLYVHPTHALLRQELADFPLGTHDDTIDALAYHLSFWRGTLSPERLERLEKHADEMVRQVLIESQPGTINARELEVIRSSGQFSAGYLAEELDAPEQSYGWDEICLG